MLSRAPSLATVMLFIGCLAAEPAQAQAQNLEAGKSPSQIFAGTCSACHKSPRGLLKTVAPGSLPGFLRQHYTTSPDMANVLSSYLASNGANDTRYAAQPKGTKDGAKDSAKDGAKEGAKDGNKEARSDAKPEPKPDAKPDLLDRFGLRPHPARANEEASHPDSEPGPAARPDADAVQQGEGVRESGRRGRNAKRLARPADAPGEAARPDSDGQVPAQAAGERGSDGRKLTAKQRLSKRSKPGGEEAVKDRDKDPFREFFREREQRKAEPSRQEPASTESPASDSGKIDTGKPEGVSSMGDGPSQAAKTEPPKSDTAKTEPFKSEQSKDGDSPALRPDSMPPVAAAPAASTAPAAASTGGGSDPGSTQSVTGSPSSSSPPFAASPPLAAPAAGPPTPPISQ
jgi:hypothetical protein